MNRSKLLTSSLAALLVIYFSISGFPAGAANPENPSPPEQAAMIPPNMQWTIKVTALKSDPTLPALKQIQGERSKSLRHETMIWSNSTTDRWTTKGAVLEKRPDRPSILVTPLPKSPILSEKRLGMINELRWIAKKNYKGTTKVGERACHYFEHTETIDLDPEADGSASQTEKTDLLFVTFKAWLDPVTGFPVAFENDRYRYEYAFESAQNLDLKLPDEFTSGARKADPTFSE